MTRLAVQAITLDPLTAVLSGGATASAAGVSMPGPVRIGTTTLAAAPWNVAAGLDEDELGDAYIRDASNLLVRKYSKTGSALAVSPSIPVGYGVAVQRPLQRVYATVDSPAEVRWYGYSLSTQLGSWTTTNICRSVMALPSGNLLLLEDASPFRVVEYAPDGTSPTVWFTGSASYRPQRCRHDGTWVYVSFYNSFSSGSRAVKRLLIADKGATNANFMPATFVAAAGVPDLPWDGADRVGDYVTRVGGIINGKLVYSIMSHHTAFAELEVDPSTGNAERVNNVRSGTPGGKANALDQPLGDLLVGAEVLWDSSYTTHDVRNIRHVTAVAEFQNVGTFLSGATLKGAFLQGTDIDQNKCEVAYRLNQGAWNVVQPGMFGPVSIAMAQLDFRVRMNIHRGFSAGVLGPLDKTPPVAKLTYVYDDAQDPPRFAMPVDKVAVQVEEAVVGTKVAA